MEDSGSDDVKDLAMVNVQEVSDADHNSTQASGHAVGPRTVDSNHDLDSSEASPITEGTHSASLRQALASLAANRELSEQADHLRKHSSDTPCEVLSSHELTGTRQASRHLCNYDAFLLGNKSPMVTVQNMEDDS
jgi:hypothetical protein